MNVLVTGGSGFIGSHAADALSDAGNAVTIFDLTIPQYLRDDQSFVQGNTLDSDQVAAAIQGKDAVFHFAGFADLELALGDPIGTVEQNILGTVTTLEASRQANVQRYVYASSIYVYSENGSFYRCSKQAAELYVEEYQRLHGLDYTILRYGSVYGPRADDYNSVRAYLRQALLEERIVVRGPSDVMREYIHVRDAAHSSVTILADEYKNEHVVLTGHHSMRYEDLLAMIREIVGRDVEIDFQPSDDADPRSGASGHYVMSPYSFRPKMAKKLVNNPYLDMGEGLLECLEEIYEQEGRRD